MMTFEVLKIIHFMLRHGFYVDLRELREVAKPMVNLLNGANDIYFDVEDSNVASTIDDFVSVKRYFNTGDNDIIIECKALVCENLLLISQLEIDGKTQIFLSKFKSDLDMLMMQQRISAETPKTGKDKTNTPQDEQNQGGLFGGFKMTLPTLELDLDGSNKKTETLEQKNVKFLQDISSSYNFELDN